MGKESYKPYKPKNEELINLLELVAGQKIILINTEKEEVIKGLLGEKMVRGLPIKFKIEEVNEEGIKEAVIKAVTKEVTNIKMVGEKIYLQTPDAVYELKIK
jgi:hypothetical protein